MKLNKVIVSKEASDYLKQLKARTGLMPNILSRIGFCLSLSEPSVPETSIGEEGGGREFNRYTLLGEWDDLYVAILRQRLLRDDLPMDEIETQFRAHLHRGIISLAKLVKCLPDLARLHRRALTVPDEAVTQE
jgi:DNA sulfur modification protein DndE